jgi:hypothetical protein
MANPVTFLLRAQEFAGSKSSQTLAILTSFRGLCHFLQENEGIKKLKKLNSVASVREQTHQPNDRRLSATESVAWSAQRILTAIFSAF